MSVTDDLTREVNHARVVYEGEAGHARMVLSELKRMKNDVSLLTNRIEYLEKISALLSTYADDRQTVVHAQIEGIVSKGLHTIFGEPLFLRLRTKINGRRPELDFVLVSQQGTETLETSILDARGGGVAAVAGFLIQAVLVLLTPNLRPVLFLDETFSQVSEEYREPLALFIRELTIRSGLQVILVTHSPEFGQSADRVYRFSQTHGVTSVEEVKDAQ